MGKPPKYPALPQVPPVIGSPAEHLAQLWPCFHAGRPLGDKTVARRERGEFARHESALIVRASKPNPNDLRPLRGATLPEIVASVNALAGQPDIDITLHCFDGWRKTDLLKWLTCFALDFDIPQVTAGQVPVAEVEAAIGKALDRCAKQNIPAPNLLVRTGKGFHLYWLFDRPVPACALERWQSAQKRLIEQFTGGGVVPDEKVKDCTRVLRLVGTVNSRSHLNGAPWRVTCDVLHQQRHRFDDLCAAVFHFTRPQVHAYKAKLGWGSTVDVVLTDDLTTGLRGINRIAHGHQAKRAERQFNVLISQINQKCPNGVVAEGSRSHVLFITACLLAWMVSPERLQEAIQMFAVRHLDGLNGDKDILCRVGEVLARAATAARYIAAGGNPSVYDDRRYVISPAYIVETLTHLFESREDQKLMLDLGGRRLQRNRCIYSKMGIRNENIETALRAHALREAGHTMQAVADQLGTTKKTISKWLGISQGQLQQALANFQGTHSPPRPVDPPKRGRPSPKERLLPEKAVNGAPRLAPGDFIPRPGGIHDGGARGGAESPIRPVDNSQLGSKTPVRRQVLRPGGPGPLAQAPGVSTSGRKNQQPWRFTSIQRALELAGCWLRLDDEFVPKKNRDTRRYFLTRPNVGHVLKITITNDLWFVEKGLSGRGNVDCMQALLGLDFKQCVELLEADDSPPF